MPMDSNHPVQKPVPEKPTEAWKRVRDEMEAYREIAEANKKVRESRERKVYFVLGVIAWLAVFALICYAMTR